MKKVIVFTGGGTGGHVIPNLPLITVFQQENWDVHYVGSCGGVEERLIRPQNIPFHTVQSGKLRRYFSWKNLTDPFRLLRGIIQAWWLFGRLKPSVVFSKGGFVAVPVVIAAWLRRIPVVSHESDMSPGLANKLSYPFVKKICLTFELTQSYFKNADKTIVTGTPTRPDLLLGDKQRGLQKAGLKGEKPCLLIMGGSQGAEAINTCVREALPKLLLSYEIIHLCGRGKSQAVDLEQAGYRPFEYADEEMADFFAASDMVVSRSGSNTLWELVALKKPHVLIPLSNKASRGDQIQNAQYFQEKVGSHVISEENLNPEILMAGLSEVMNRKNELSERLASFQQSSAVESITTLLKEQGHA